MKNKTSILTLLFPLFLTSCAEDFLDIKRNKKQATPSSIEELQAILDNVDMLNRSTSYGLNIISGEEYYITDDVWNLLPSAMQQNAYIWAKDIFEGAASSDWENAYGRIFYANNALDGIVKIQAQAFQQTAWNNVKGTALFIRSYNFYQLAQTFCKPYHPETAATDLGIPLRLEADITLPVKRATVALTYQQMFHDLKEAARLLPIHAIHKLRPAKSAAYGLLAKVSMDMGQFEEAKTYADSCIFHSEGLMDYNQIDPNLRYPFSTRLYGIGNSEVLYYESILGLTIVNTTRFCINPDLYALYEEGDIRKTAYFFPTRGTYNFKGSYTGAYNFFGGIGLDEIVLLRAECHARNGRLALALEDLNALLSKRYKSAVFTPFESTITVEVMDRILEERRKELLCRGIRWSDLRRLNAEPSYSKVLEREVDGQLYTLEPGDPRYVFPIPDQVINISGVQQNPR